MGLASWMVSTFCDHPKKTWVRQTLEYANGQKDHSIYCGTCGKVILPSSDYESMRALFSRPDATEVK